MRRFDEPRSLIWRNGWLLRVTALVVLIAACGAWRTGPFAQPMQLADQQPVQVVRIGVFSLFKPTELVLRADEGSSLEIDLDGHPQILPNGGQAVVRVSDGGIQLQLAAEPGRMRGNSLRVPAQSNARAEEPTHVWLEVPGKLRRRYTGTLEIQSRGQILEAIVTMPLETAVASIVQAESPPGAAMEALKAQAVAARSFLVARQTSHVNFDFCDTTHCQFLRSPPAAGSPAATATRATEGLILTWHDDAAAQDRTLAAMYARSCGGRTRTLREIGVQSAGYPYYAVRCVYCTHHPEIWQRKTELSARTEQERLAFNRVHGWGAIPSLATSDPSENPDALLSGRGVGHGLGLCQLGAADMARHGAGFAQILAHYYPNTRLTMALAHG
jgi:stage II sporulation protein D